MSTIFVTGGTGMLGSRTVPLLRAAGHELRVLSRTASGEGVVRGELRDGSGVAEAARGADVVVHLASVYGGDPGMTESLLRGIAEAGGRPHLLMMSVVGVDRLSYERRIDRQLLGYFHTKLLAEEAVRDSGLPWTILRATQFRESLGLVAAALARMPVSPVPRGFRFQPIDPAVVARRVAELVEAGPSGLVDPLGGPEVYTIEELVRSYLAATGRRRPLLRIGVPGSAARAYREGANLAPEHAVAEGTWEEYLEEVGAAASVAG